MPWSADGDHTHHDSLAPPSRQKDSVHQQNINYGRGIFNTVNGTQNFNMNITWNLHSKSPPKNASPLLIEPYQSAIGLVFDIIQLLDGLSQSSAVSTLRHEAEGFVPVLVCAAKAIETVRRVAPQFATHTFFANMDSQAIECGRRLKKLRTDIHEYSVHLDNIMLSSTVRQIFLLVFPPHRWRPLSYRIRECIQANQLWLERFLCALTK